MVLRRSLGSMAKAKSSLGWGREYGNWRGRGAEHFIIED